MDTKIKIALSAFVGLIIGATASFYVTSKFLGEFMEHTFLSFEGSDSMMLVHALNRLQEGNVEGGIEILEQDLGTNMISISHGMEQFPKGINSVDKAVPMVKEYWSKYPFSYGNEEIQSTVNNYVNSQ